MQKSVQGIKNFIFDVLSENVITFVTMYLLLYFVNLMKTCFLKSKSAYAYATVRKYFWPQMSIIQFDTLT